MDEQTARRDLIRICQLMYERSYVVSSDGNVSVVLERSRAGDATMTCKGRMTEDLLARTDLEGRSLNGSRASSELAIAPADLSRAAGLKAVCTLIRRWDRLRRRWTPIDQPILSEVILTLGVSRSPNTAHFD